MLISAENLKKTVCALTDGIGVRLAGSLEERQAADYLAGELSRYASRVWIEEYPVFERHVTHEKLEVNVGGTWVEYPCSLFSGAVGTDGKTIEGELVYFDTVTGYMQPDLSWMKGKAVVHLGCHIVDEASYQRLMEAEPAFLLFVDTRYPADLPLADGLFPEYVKKHGSRTTLNVAFQHAWKWRSEGATAARVSVCAEARPSMTSVVVAELTGTEPEAGVIYCGGHHDTQANTVGADDNAVGCAAVLELARALSETPHRRTFRLCCFGAEEQLSQGSAAYVRRHREEISRDGVIQWNFDSCGSLLGWNDFTVNGTPELTSLIRGTFAKRGLYYRESTEACPYTDQFPFAACGVPGIWVGRNNCNSGMFYHHRIDNTPDKLDFQIVADLVEASMDVLTLLADREDIRELRGIPEQQQAEIDALFGSVYGGF